MFKAFRTGSLAMIRGKLTKAVAGSRTSAGFRLERLWPPCSATNFRTLQPTS